MIPGMIPERTILLLLPDRKIMNRIDETKHEWYKGDKVNG
jgi:hypothetical protein